MYLIPAPIGPPAFADGRRRRPFALLQAARAPGLELLARQFDRSVRDRDQDMHVVGPAIHRMKDPLPNRTVFGDRFLDEPALVRVQG
jgi:hypothetical protein